jgi:adenylate kinase
MRLVLLGAPGSGKGTQAARLIVHLNIVHISTGDIFRQAIRDKTELGRKANEFMHQGQLVPDNIVLDIIRDRLSRHDCANGFILDGFPRTIPQAEGLKKLLSQLMAPVDWVIDIEVSTEVLINRLSARRVCRKCGQDFNLNSNPPPSDMVHPNCGGEIIQRDDDRPETIRKRLEVYHRQTEPLRGFYRREGLFAQVDGAGTADEVFARILQIVDAR